MMAIGKPEKMRKGILALAAILMLTTLVVTAYFAEASILYQDIPYQYKKTGNQWFTIDRIDNVTSAGTFTTVQCQNRRLLHGTFNIVVKLKNPAFTDSNIQVQRLDNTTVKVTYLLRSQEKTSTNIYFIVEPNATNFEVSISLETSQLFLRSNIPGMYAQATFPYSVSSNNTWATTETWTPAMIA